MADASPRARGVHARRRVAPALVAASALAVELAMWGLNTSLSTGGDAPVAVVVAVAVTAYAPLALGASPLRVLLGHVLPNARGQAIVSATFGLGAVVLLAWLYSRAAVGGNAQYNSQWNVHWYAYPLIYWMEIVADFLCLEAGSIDVLYISEIDPLWQDS